MCFKRTVNVIYQQDIYKYIKSAEWVSFKKSSQTSLFALIFHYSQYIYC